MPLKSRAGIKMENVRVEIPFLAPSLMTLNLISAQPMQEMLKIGRMISKMLMMQIS